jgi:hypothetical protein
VGIPISVPTAVALPTLASGGLGLMLPEWVARYGQPDALVEGLYLFDESERTLSLLVVNNRVATIYVAWKSEARPNLGTAQAAALQLLPLDSSLVQASNLAADQFVGVYQSAQLATLFPDAPYGTQPAGTFTVIYQLAGDGAVFQTVVGIGELAPTRDGT